LVDADVAKAPVAFIAGVAAPVALVCPGETAGAKSTALETVMRVEGGEGFAAVCSSCGLGRGDVAVGGEHVRSFGIGEGAGVFEVFPLVPCCVAKAEPVQTSC